MLKKSLTLFFLWTQCIDVHRPHRDCRQIIIITISFINICRTQLNNRLRLKMNKKQSVVKKLPDYFDI